MRKTFFDTSACEDDYIQIEIQNEFANPGKFKIYIHVNGSTIFRMGKVKSEQLAIIGLKILPKNAGVAE